ncbi:MAG: HNH endonuclease [Actinobacteria bacterium]|nr:HNH endonuclease [Actinomycetota bacterium]
MTKPCLDCGRRSRGSRCPACAARRQHFYNSTGWKQTRARARASQCSSCGATSRLSVHHLDGDVGNNDAGNLVTLCLRCHGALDANRISVS